MKKFDKTGNCPPLKISKSSWNTDVLYIFFFFNIILITLVKWNLEMHKLDLQND